MYCTAFVIEVTGVHILGGTQIGSGVTLTQCKNLCENMPTCLALDFDEGNCRAHDHDTYCESLRRKDGVIHAKKLPCGISK